MPKYICSVCSSEAKILDVVDFNKNCEERNGKFLEKTGVPVYYAICEGCSFVFAPEFANWTQEEFTDKIYNHKYIDVDPDYLNKRSNSNLILLNSLFGDKKNNIRHLDYGGGNGELSRLLAINHWISKNYDPFSTAQIKINDLGAFNFITAFEVFEHVPNPSDIMENLKILIEDDGLILFSTLVNDGNIKINERLNWWYASPRNGHVSLHSYKSLKILGENYDFNFGSLGIGVHVYYKNFPKWANSLLAGSV